jgi:ABC-type Mn2+/Zn2+ transport system permease subunit
MGIIFIVALLALPVFLVAKSTKNKKYTIASAIVMSAIASVTGSPHFLSVDLMGIGIATYFGFEYIKNESAN